MFSFGSPSSVLGGLGTGVGISSDGRSRHSGISGSGTAAHGSSDIDLVRPHFGYSTPHR
jgi:hypothetical protein